MANIVMNPVRNFTILVGAIVNINSFSSFIFINDKLVKFLTG